VSQVSHLLVFPCTVFARLPHDRSSVCCCSVSTQEALPGAGKYSQRSGGVARPRWGSKWQDYHVCGHNGACDLSF
ncbi:hypothetical protein EV401DRAFT_1931112, partial [Pisolithus croceorrhizus]